MTTDEFKAFVAANDIWFRGRLPESSASLDAVEATLGVTLPESLRWVLMSHGYWHGTAVSNLDNAVMDTLSAREHLGLPRPFVVLQNLQDAGVIIIDTSDETTPGDPALYWIGLEGLGPVPQLTGTRRYPSYGAYVADVLPTVQDGIESDAIRYDPLEYPEGAAERSGR